MKSLVIAASLLALFILGNSNKALAYGTYGGSYSSSGGTSGLYLNPGGIYSYQYEDNTSSPNQSNVDFIGKTRSEINFRIGYKFESVIHLGLLFIQDVYNQQYFYNIRETYQSFGAYVGLMWDNWDISVSYLLNPTLRTENMDQNRNLNYGPSTDYSGNYGLSFDVAYKWNMFGSFDIGPRLSWRYWEYGSRTQKQPVVVVNNTPYRYMTFYPELAVYFHF